MRDLKKVFCALTFVFALGLTSCTKPDTASEDELYGQEAVDLSKVKRPGSAGGAN